MKVSIVIPTYNRPHLLKWNLYSLSKQRISFDFETIVLNDGQQEDGTEGVSKEYKEKLNIKYFWTGKDNTGWRVPGFSVNRGVKKAVGDIIILCCAEMFHFDNTIDMLTIPFLNNDKITTSPQTLLDDDGSFLRMLEDSGYNTESENCKIGDRLRKMKNPHLPFLMGINKNIFLGIGGYDEDFLGVDFDDDDIIRRLKMAGCSRQIVNAKVIHLYHHRLDICNNELKKRHDYNKKIFQLRYNVMKRNLNKEWGVMP